MSGETCDRTATETQATEQFRAQHRRPWQTPRVIRAANTSEAESTLTTADDGPSAVS